MPVVRVHGVDVDRVRFSAARQAKRRRGCAIEERKRRNARATRRGARQALTNLI
jgi:hypothetical protein